LRHTQAGDGWLAAIRGRRVAVVAIIGWIFVVVAIHGREVAIRGRRRIVAIRGRVVGIGYWIAVAPVLATPANLGDS
jgi:hypothetical protein